MNSQKQQLAILQIYLQCLTPHNTDESSLSQIITGIRCLGCFKADSRRCLDISLSFFLEISNIVVLVLWVVCVVHFLPILPDGILVCNLFKSKKECDSAVLQLHLSNCEWSHDDVCIQWQWSSQSYFATAVFMIIAIHTIHNFLHYRSFEFVFKGFCRYDPEQCLKYRNRSDFFTRTISFNVAFESDTIFKGRAGLQVLEDLSNFCTEESSFSSETDSLSNLLVLDTTLCRITSFSNDLYRLRRNLTTVELVIYDDLISTFLPLPVRFITAFSDVEISSVSSQPTNESILPWHCVEATRESLLPFSRSTIGMKTVSMNRNKVHPDPRRTSRETGKKDHLDDLIDEFELVRADADQIWKDCFGRPGGHELLVELVIDMIGRGCIAARMYRSRFNRFYLSTVIPTPLRLYLLFLYFIYVCGLCYFVAKWSIQLYHNMHLRYVLLRLFVAVSVVEYILLDLMVAVVVEACIPR